MMNLQLYLDAYKLFGIKGIGYLVVICNMIYGIDIDFNGLYVMQLLDNEILPQNLVIAQRTDVVSLDNFFDIRIYNLIYPYIMKYSNPALLFTRLDDTYVDDVREFKSTAKSQMKNFHEQDDIRNEYLLPIFYKMYPVVKTDSVENYISSNANEYILKSVVHKKKQKRDIYIYRRFISLQ